MAKRNKKQRVDASQSGADEPMNNPFARLLGGEEPESAGPAPTKANDLPLSHRRPPKPIPAPRSTPSRTRASSSGTRGKSAPETEEPTISATPEGELAGKLVVRREKKGRGGKTVTRVSGLRAGPERLEVRAKELAKALGARGWVEEHDVLVAGDQTATVQKWLERAGAAKVVIGN